MSHVFSASHGIQPPWPQYSLAPPLGPILSFKLFNLDLSTATLYPEPNVAQWPEALRKTYEALQRHLQISPQLAIGVMVSVMSAAASPLRRVRTPDGKEGPTACWIRLLANTSEGKSETLKALTKGHDAFHAEELQRFQAEQSRYELKRKTFHARERSYLKSLGRMTDDEIEREGEKLQSSKPEQPKLWPAIMTSGTAAGIEREMRDSYGFAAYINPDAGDLEVDSILADGPRFCKHWSGDMLRRKTGTSGDLVGISPSLTLTLMPQPSEAERQDRRYGARSSGNGFRARMPSISCEPFAAKKVVHWDVISTITEASPEIAWFNDETYKLMKAGATLRAPRIDVFEPAAATCYFRLKEVVVNAASPISGQTDIQDCWGKAVELTCRTASLIQAMDGDTGVITAQHFCAAADLTLFYLQHAKLLYGKKATYVEPQEQKDARALEEFLSRRCAQLGGKGLINRNDVLRWGPNQLRNRQRRDAALALLYAGGRMHCTTVGRTCYLVLNSQFFPEATYYGPPARFG